MLCSNNCGCLVSPEWWLPELAQKACFFFCLDWNSHRVERQLKGICQKHLKANGLATAARGRGNSWRAIHIPKSLGGKDGE